MNKMKVGIMQPYFLPYIGYWQLINAIDTFILLDDVNYINRGWINRNRILINGQPKYITVPLCNASQNKLINEISIVKDSTWKKNILKTIELNYKKAPYFAQIFPIVHEIIFDDKTGITEYIESSLKLICTYIGINTQILLSSKINKDNTLKAQDRIIEICKRLSADTYINPQGGKDLYNQESFQNNGINLHFLVPENIAYKQFGNEFVLWLSILDILMFNSIEETKEMLNKYILL
jgi:hypothetical protein